MPSSYGWAIAAVALVAFLGLAMWALGGMRRRERAAADAENLAEGNKVVADANRAGADALGRDLGPTPGLELQKRDKPTGQL